MPQLSKTTADGKDMEITVVMGQSERGVDTSKDAASYEDGFGGGHGYRW